MKILVMYHRVDFDGLFSGAIVKKFFESNLQNELTMKGWTYGDYLPEIPELLQFDKIIMVDISLPPEIMIALRDSKKAVWIDHHDSAITLSKEHGYNDFPGIRVNNIAACELTWLYCYPKIKCPLIIQYVGAYDVWNKQKFPWDEKTLPIQFGLRTKFQLHFTKLYNNFNKLITDDNLIKLFLFSGRSVLEYKKNEWQAAIKAYGFPVQVAGQYKGIAIISACAGSAQFESILSEYDIYIVVNRKGPDSYSLSMYKEPDRLPEFNCAEYVMKTFNNGGGHPSACGTTLNLEQFINLTTKQEL